MTFPEKLPIRWMSDLHTSHIGRFNGSNQFFLAHHRIPLAADSAEYLVLYCFDSQGKLSSHAIHGPLERVNDETIATVLSPLGPHEFTDICAIPFQIQFQGHVFGLIPDPSHFTITLEPGSMITFTAPWDGEYYT
jgi:hypothetical protein